MFSSGKILTTHREQIKPEHQREFCLLMRARDSSMTGNPKQLHPSSSPTSCLNIYIQPPRAPRIPNQTGSDQTVLPAIRITALSAGSRTSPEADLDRFIRWCLGRFQGSVSPGTGEQLEEFRSTELSSDAARTRGLLRGAAFTSSMFWRSRNIHNEVNMNNEHQIPP